ncbi:MAG: tetratricopeptide repeat protein [Gammaproteobacteria bacterium]|nr:tetratricopeptide repeat protein [Gammaproteobacteria bacterium]MBQ0839217.1 tetratricopeptide repeat protein [Gammaproteobacteria bacterium]
MRPHLARPVSFFLLTLLLVSTAMPVAASHEKKEAKQGKYANADTRRRQAVGQRCAKKLEAAQRAINVEQWPQAEQVLTLAAEKYCASSFEKSQVWNYLAYTHFSQQHYRRAVEAYLRLLDEPAAEEKMKVSTYNTVAQLYFQLEDYASAAQFLERLLKVSDAADPQTGGVRKADAQTADSQTKALLAQAYYQLGRKNAALTYLKQAIDDYQQRDKLPPEAWWSLQSLLYFEQEQYRQALPVLKQLIKHYPRYRYWHQLGGLYGQLGKDVERLVATEIVYLAGALNKERELVSLSYLYLGANTPYRAAVTLETAIKKGQVKAIAKHLELLGQAWQQAGEGKKARPVLEQAAALSGEGKIYAQLAGVYLDIGDNVKAVTAARNALQKGQLKRPGAVQLVLGNAQLNLHCYKQAVKAFEQAGKYKASAVNAKQWSSYARAEGERVNELRAAGAVLPGCGA